MPTSPLNPPGTPAENSTRTSGRGAAILTLSVLLTSTITPSASGITSSAGDGGPNFTESSTCGIYGVRGPQAASTQLGGTETVYGPFADFFGRNRTQVGSATTSWRDPSGHLYRVHGRIIGALNQVSSNLTASGGSYPIWSGAAWVWRTVSGRRQLSHHAFGNALDINPPTNPYRADGTLISDMPTWFVDAWESAGFCWGGSWAGAKDAMHFSWRGPTATPGADVRLAPFPPLTAASPFHTLALDRQVAVNASGAAWAASDRRREGADDLYQVVADGGQWQVRVAGAIHHFDRLGIRRTSSAPESSGPVLLADYDLDGRADLWSFTTSGSSISAQVYADSNRFAGRSASVSTSASWSGDAELGLAALDWDDWAPDLFVVRRDTGRVEVFSSSSGYTNLIASGATQLGPLTNGEALVLADVDGDGRPDLLAVSRGSSATVRLVRYRTESGYGGPIETLSTAMTIGTDDVVMPGDWDGDGRADLYVLSGSRLRIWLGGVPDRPVGDLHRWFTPDDPVYFDAGPPCQMTCDQIGYVDRSGRWRLATLLEWGPPEATFFYGNPGDIPFLGDWDGDGSATPGLFRPSDGFVYLRNSNTQGVADLSFFFGNPGDVPLVGDWDGDGKDTVSIYRPSEARFYVINRLGDSSRGLGAADYSFLFGNPGDRPFVGDLDGDNIDEVALQRVTTGRVYYRHTLTEGVADRDFIFGDPHDFVLAGDWDGDGTDTVGLYRPSDGNWYLRLSNSQGVADHVIPFGLGGIGGIQPFSGPARIADGGLGTLECGDCDPDGG